MDVKEEETFSGSIEQHWYYRSKSMALERMLHNVPYANILDVGAGSGVFSRCLLAGRAKSAICVDPAYRQEERSELVAEGKRIRFVRCINESGADLVLLMDVLEHVEDDVELIHQAMRGSKAGAHALITVPAFQCLFSAHDFFLEHKRRYTLQNLESVVKRAGLEVVSSRYFFALLLPLAASLRLLQRHQSPKSNLRQHTRLMNEFMTILNRIELPLMSINRIAGLSIFCLAKKP